MNEVSYDELAVIGLRGDAVFEPRCQELAEWRHFTGSLCWNRS